MVEPELNELVGEHIALLTEARQERDQYKQQVIDLSHALLHEQMANADLLAALELYLSGEPGPEYKAFVSSSRMRTVARTAISKAKGG